MHEDKQKVVNNFDKITDTTTEYLEASNELTQNIEFGIKIYPNPTSMQFFEQGRNRPNDNQLVLDQIHK